PHDRNMDPLSDRILPAPVARRHRGIDHGDAWSAGNVTLRDVPAVQEPDTHRSKVTRTRHLNAGPGLGSGSGDRRAVDRECRGELTVPTRKARRSPRGNNTRRERV